MAAVDAEDARRHRLARTHHVARVQKAPLGQLGDVDQPFQLLLQNDERAVGSHITDDAGHQLTGAIAALDVLPRVGVQALHAQGDTFGGLIHAEHQHLDLLPRPQERAGVGHTAPGDLGDMDEALQAAKIDKGAEIGQVGNDTVAPLLRLDAQQQHLALLRSDQRSPLGKDEPAVALINLNDLESELTVLPRLQRL